MTAAMITFAPPFADAAAHFVFVIVAGSRYAVREITGPEDAVAVAAAAAAATTVDAIFVEGNRAPSPQLRHEIARMPGHARRVCHVCEQGEQGVFKAMVMKPVLPWHVRSFMAGVRYRKEAADVPQEGATGEQASRILVVEDNTTNQFVMRKILQNVGCTFEIAENGQAAIDTVERDQFDLVFMDCQMPILDGLESTRIIRKCGKQYSSIPIVALAASAVEGDEQTCRDAGMDGYVANPVRIQQIKSAIGRFNG
jgi:CheY-like chemotaxis protein